MQFISEEDLLNMGVTELGARRKLMAARLALALLLALALALALTLALALALALALTLAQAGVQPVQGRARGAQG